ncbi:MAG TPA: serine hydrolase domain-containing protein [Pyrinomonadaceae bacterium]|nr:serine hydrolase domain-containing protein [Pyrinomonadaceae bacterium]
MITKLKISIALLIAAAMFSAASGQTFDKAKLDQFFDRLAEKNKAMGSVAVVKDGSIVYSRAIGYSQINGAEKTQLTTVNRFRIGSITKLFTATMVLQLVEAKKLKLTDTLDKFFPQVPNALKITIAQILAHRSGIHDSIIDPKMRQASRADAVSKDELLALVTKGTPDFEPDARQRYSNSGYFLLGLVIEKVTGKPYEKVLAEKITSKIGLKDTYMATGNIDLSKNEALTYMFLGEWKPVPETHPTNLFGGGAIISTPTDMAKFIQALFDGKLVSSESLTLMKTVRDGDDMGVAMEPFTFAGRTFYGHTGGADNYGAWLAYLPEEKLAVAYTTNAKVYPVKDILSGVVDIYYGRPFQVPTFEAFAVSTETLDKYVGVYSTPGAPVKLTITRKGSTLFFQPPGEQSAAQLEAIAENKFQIEGAVVIEFDAAKSQMTVRRRGGERVFTKDK